MNATAADLARLLASFFTRHLVAERNASGHTVRSYRDTFRLFLRHVSEKTSRRIGQLTLQDFTPNEILSFLDHLEKSPCTSVATLNARLAALRFFFSYVVSQEVSSVISWLAT